MNGCRSYSRPHMGQHGSGWDTAHHLEGKTLEPAAVTLDPAEGNDGQVSESS